jgi:hypothetical protein
MGRWAGSLPVPDYHRGVCARVFGATGSYCAPGACERSKKFRGPQVGLGPRFRVGSESPAVPRPTPPRHVAAARGAYAARSWRASVGRWHVDRQAGTLAVARHLLVSVLPRAVWRLSPSMRPTTRPVLIRLKFEPGATARLPLALCATITQGPD